MLPERITFVAFVDDVTLVVTDRTDMLDIVMNYALSLVCNCIYRNGLKISVNNAIAFHNDDQERYIPT